MPLASSARVRELTNELGYYAPGTILARLIRSDELVIEAVYPREQISHVDGDDFALVSLKDNKYTWAKVQSLQFGLGHHDEPARLVLRGRLGPGEAIVLLKFVSEEEVPYSHEILEKEQRDLDGGSGTGKSTAEIKHLVAEAERGTSAIVVLDPHINSLAYNFLSHCVALGLESRIVYDRLTDLDRVLMWDFLSPSKEKEEHKRKNQNSTRCSRFTEVLLRQRGKASASDTPSIAEWVKAALNLYIYQRQRKPLADIRYAFAKPAAFIPIAKKYRLPLAEDATEAMQKGKAFEQEVFERIQNEE